MRDKKQQYYKVLDVTRLYCAALIVFIHMGISSKYAILFSLTRQAVPFFFMVSGFFYAQKIKKSKNAMFITRQYVVNVMCVYLIWNLLWSPIIINEYRQLYPDSTIKLLAALFRRFLLAGIAPYWYLLILAEGVLILTFVIKNSRRTLGAFLCILGLILRILYNIEEVFYQKGIIYQIFYTLFSWSNNVIMFGFPMLFIGAEMQNIEKKIRKQNNLVVLLFLYAVSLAIPYIGFHLNKEFTNALPYGEIQGMLLFLICIHPTMLETTLSEKISLEARNLSSVLFFTHTIFLTVLGKCFHIWDNFLRYIATLLFSVLLLIITKKMKLRHVKYLLMVK